MTFENRHVKFHHQNLLNARVELILLLYHLAAAGVEEFCRSRIIGATLANNDTAKLSECFCGTG